MSTLKLLPIVLLVACDVEPTRVQETEPVTPQPVSISPQPVAVQPITQPITQPEEMIVVYPTTPYVYYTVEQKWEQPSIHQRPTPSLVIRAQVQFDDVGAEMYGIIRDQVSTQAMVLPGADPYTFQITRPGLLESLDLTDLPVIQVQSISGDNEVLSQAAQWVMQ